MSTFPKGIVSENGSFPTFIEKNGQEIDGKIYDRNLYKNMIF